jgi:hypothetical protein
MIYNSGMNRIHLHYYHFSILYYVRYTMTLANWHDSTFVVSIDVRQRKDSNAFFDIGLFRRQISQERPIRTTYELTKEGKELVRHLTDLQNL